MRLALIIILATLSLAVQGQTIPNYKRPIFVSHLSGKQKYMLVKPGAPKHNAIAKFICFKYKCRSVIGWTRTQQRNKFKGYKKPGIPRLQYLKNDSLRENNVQPKQVVRDSSRIAGPVSEPVSEPMRQDSVVSFVFNDVLFDVNSSHIKNSFTSQLDSVSNVIREHKNYRIEVIGHTDNSGSERANTKLSEDRAIAVANYLASTGIDPEVISADGRGSSEPIADNSTMDGRSKNRRVEILLRFH